MEALLTAALTADAGLAALVDDRVNWHRLPDRKALPAVILHDVGAQQPERLLSGQRVGLTPYLLQMDCWAGTLAQAIAVQAALVAVLDTLIPAPLQAQIERRHGAWEPAPGPGADRAADLFRRSLDVRLWHTET